MESLISMSNYIKDFHYEFHTKNVTLNYREAETESGSYLPIVFDVHDIMPVTDFLALPSVEECIYHWEFDAHRQDNILIDIYFKYETSDESIKIICSEAIRIIKEIAKNKKEECQL